MHILAAVYAPGAAEAIGEVIKTALVHGDTVTAITLGAEPVDRGLGGATAAFERLGLAHTDLRQMDYAGDGTQVPGEFADALITRERPDAVLVGCSRDPSGTWRTLEDALVESSRTARIASVQVIDSWDVWFPRVWGGGAGWLAVPDAAARRVIERRNAGDAHRIVATGQPALDTLTRESVRDRRAVLRESLGIDDATRVVLYCGQVSSDNPRTLRWTLSSLGSGDRLIFQKHPRDTRDYAAVLADAGARIMTGAPRGDAVFAIADICVTHTSTVGLRAVAHGVRVVNILLPGELQDVRELCGGYPLSVLGLSREVSDAEGLRAALDDAGPPPDERALREGLLLDGRAAERVWTLLSKAGASKI